MIHSMTGFGKSEATYKSKKITIELKALNSKQTDIYAKLPNIYKSKELGLRTLIQSKLKRGKIDFFVRVEDNGEQSAAIINEATVTKYYSQLTNISSNIKADFSLGDILPALLRMPEVLTTEREDLSDDEYKVLSGALQDAINQVEEFRTQEGAALEKDIKKRIGKITSMLEEIEPFEKLRVETIKIRLEKSLNELAQKDKFDQNRFEQELIYYIEKFDITEEKVRLKNHCQYFLDTIEQSAGEGKKLGFIGQEIGREINTIGSKANDSDIQKIVVQMKDELEKIKEQLMNVL